MKAVLLSVAGWALFGAVVAPLLGFYLRRRQP
jgi:hypothetical protein